jgi:CheY-like chemotaxis protein
MFNVLVVEDSATEAQLLSNCLQQSGFQVLSVTTAEAAKVMLQQQNFDAILMDVCFTRSEWFWLMPRAEKSGKNCKRSHYYLLQ